MQEANLIFFGICYTNMLFMIPAKYQNLSKCTFVFRYSFSFKMLGLHLMLLVAENFFFTIVIIYMEDCSVN